MDEARESSVVKHGETFEAFEILSNIFEIDLVNTRDSFGIPSSIELICPK